MSFLIKICKYIVVPFFSAMSLSVLASPFSLNTLLSTSPEQHPAIFKNRSYNPVPLRAENNNCLDLLPGNYEKIEADIAGKNDQIFELKEKFKKIESLEYGLTMSPMTKDILGEYAKKKNKLQTKINNLQAKINKIGDIKKSYKQCLKDDSQELAANIFMFAAPAVYESAYENRYTLGEGSSQIPEIAGGYPEDYIVRYMLNSNMTMSCIAASTENLTSFLTSYFESYAGGSEPSSILNWQHCSVSDGDAWDDEVLPQIDRVTKVVDQELTQYWQYLSQQLEHEKQIKQAQEQAKVDAFNQRVSQLKAGKIKPENFDEILYSINKFNKADMMLMVRPQAYQPFENAYLLGAFDGGDITKYFRLELHGRGEVLYVEVDVNDKTKVFGSVPKGQPIGMVKVVGKYIGPKSYKTRSGATRYMPVLEAEYIQY